MKPMTNTKARHPAPYGAGRQLSSVPTTHRAATLNAISQKAHSNDARIEFLAIEGSRMKDLIKQAPGDASSRLDWLHHQLTSM
ncbi:MAG: hypothetical protein AAB668_01855 [Patescibacteria group bacterium]